jgi:hypothetical protein
MTLAPRPKRARVKNCRRRPNSWRQRVCPASRQRTRPGRLRRPARGHSSYSPTGWMARRARSRAAGQCWWWPAQIIAAKHTTVSSKSTPAKMWGSSITPAECRRSHHGALGPAKPFLRTRPRATLDAKRRRGLSPDEHPRLVRGEHLTYELGDAGSHARKQERAAGGRDDRQRARVAWKGAAPCSLPLFYGCRSGAGADRAPADAWSSSRGGASRVAATCSHSPESSCGSRPSSYRSVADRASPRDGLRRRALEWVAVANEDRVGCKRLKPRERLSRSVHILIEGMELRAVSPVRKLNVASASPAKSTPARSARSEHPAQARRFPVDAFRRQPGLFAHWRFGTRPDGWTMGAR